MENFTVSQNTELEKVKSRILALSNKTVDRGCTEAEALISMQKIGELLSQYNLSMEEIDVRGEKCVKMTWNQTIYKSRTPVDGAVTTIARLCDCRCWRSFDKHGKTEYCYFGLESDAMMAVYLTDLIENAL